MKEIQFKGYTFVYSKNLICIRDNETEKMSFIANNYDGLVLVVEIIDGKLSFQPELSVNIVELDYMKYEINSSKYGDI